MEHFKMEKTGILLSITTIVVAATQASLSQVATLSTITMEDYQ
eukprot:CAMPEP_0176388614 /NCGR_PEP_ID=MMETSP0126-20121128/37713_1 /TAXON_ID=141414 ORGANISM="Strombidinopsis acuminatum, Strain SPMC142" /NCGR_SAMPLE_ID=MMETSP0126 /ASSEMBLY_ACC=CAM_ASM_000229 /LENGTH=42 /DNA_ID= /DNA_START= /DNA_END= /DNA_ORIENTATION=